MRSIPILLTVVALLIRLIVIQVWKISQIVYVPIELCLLVAALFLERDRLRSFFVRTNQINADILIGIFLGILNALYEAMRY